MEAPMSEPEPITRTFVMPRTPARVSASPLLPQLMLSPNPAESILYTELRPAQPPWEPEWFHSTPKSEEEEKLPTRSPSLPSPPNSAFVLPPTPASPAYCTIWTHLSAIFHNPNAPKIGDEAYIALKSLDLDFYLPQLCLLLVHLQSASPWIEPLVLDRCTVSLHFAIRCIFCLGAIAPKDATQHQQLIERIENYQYACQLAYINNKRPLLDQNANPMEMSSTNGQTDESNLESDSGHVRDLRFKYLTSLKHFLKALSEIGTELSVVPEGERVAKLRANISRLNSNLALGVTAPSSAQYVLGLFLPFAPSSALHHAILRIPEHEISILPSRNRVPFSLCFETLYSSSHRLSNSHLEDLIPEYTKAISQLQAEKNSIDLRVSGQGTPPHSPNSSNEPEPTRRASARPDIASHVLISNALEPSEIESSASHLKRILSVPQNAMSVRTKEKWESKEQRVQKHSIYGSHSGWKLRGTIVKYGSDGLQEQLSLQLLQLFAHIFESSPSCRARLVTYDCVVIENDATLIEPLLNAESIHQIKKNNNNIALDEYFVKKWSGASSERYAAAQRRFLITLAGSSAVSYLLQLKDRHNANIMIDDDGNLVHIDWGFLLYNTPGAIAFETAPFKLTSEMVSVIGGPYSAAYREFQDVFHEAFMLLRKHASQILDLVKIMFLCDPFRVPCAAGGQEAIDDLRNRFSLHLADEECTGLTQSLVSQSCSNWRTLNYDYFQYYTNGILS